MFFFQMTKIILQLCALHISYIYRKYKRDYKWIHNFKFGFNMTHMRVSGIEPSSMILSQINYSIILKYDAIYSQ